MFLLGFRRKLTALALCKSTKSAIQWIQIHHRITFATIQNAAVYLSGARVSIFPTLVPRLSFLTRFLPNFIYGLLFKIKYRFFPMNKTKMASSLGPHKQMLGRHYCFSACPSIHCRGHSNYVIFNRISTKFHIWVASIRLSFFIRALATNVLLVCLSVLPSVVVVNLA